MKKDFCKDCICGHCINRVNDTCKECQCCKEGDLPDEAQTCRDFKSIK